VIQDAVDVAFEFIIEYQQGLTEEALQAIQEAKPGITITVLSEEEREPFKAAAAEVEKAFIGMTGDSGQRILDQMKQDLQKAFQAVN
jgi:TRAP-type transport system periplasmic protein